MQPIQLFDADSSTYTYILFDEVSRAAVMIDPVDTQLSRDLEVLKSHGLTLKYVLETHAHADHITSSGQLVAQTGAVAATPQLCGVLPAAIQLQHGNVLTFGAEQITALHTPGHTAGSMCFVCKDHVFTGDTLLIGGCGRTDFQSGSSEALYNSISKLLFALPADTTVWPGHDYKGETHSTIGIQKTSNLRLVSASGQLKTQAEFVAMMAALNLPKPKRIDEAVPANLRMGL